MSKHVIIGIVKAGLSCKKESDCHKKGSAHRATFKSLKVTGLLQQFHFEMSMKCKYMRKRERLPESSSEMHRGNFGLGSSLHGISFHPLDAGTFISF